MMLQPLPHFTLSVSPVHTYMYTHTHSHPIKFSFGIRSSHANMSGQRDDLLNPPYGREQGRMFRTVWQAAPTANMYMRILFAFMLSEEATYNHSISSQ